MLYRKYLIRFPVTIAVFCMFLQISRLHDRGGSRIFFRRGCTRFLLYFNTKKPHSLFFLQNTSCIRIPQVISGGVRTPCTLSLDLPLHDHAKYQKPWYYKLRHLHHTNWRLKICIWRLYFSSWSPKGDLRIFLFSSPSKLVFTVVQRPISAYPGAKFNLGFFFFCSKAFSWIIFSVSFKSIQTSTFRQKEFNWMYFFKSLYLNSNSTSFNHKLS